MAWEVEQIGFTEFLEAMQKAKEVALPLGARAVGESLEAILMVMKPYAPQPSRNRAKHFNTYVRGVGHYPRSAFSQSGDKFVVNHKQASKARKQGRVRYTSQQMDKRWRMQVKQKGDEVEGELRNEATYSGYVLGPKDGDPHQVSFHAETGWQNLDDGLAQAQSQIDRAFDRAVDELIVMIGSL